MRKVPSTARIPPDTTENCSLDAEATTPALRSPRRGPLLTTATCTPEIRPRRYSGTVNWTMVPLNTADTTSAAPATARRARATGSVCTTPNRVVVTAKTRTDETTINPCLFTVPTQPAVEAATSDPTPGAA